MAIYGGEADARDDYDAIKEYTRDLEASFKETMAGAQESSMSSWPDPCQISERRTARIGPCQASPGYGEGAVMDADRFDAFSKTFAGRLSRRSAMRRGGVGLAATLLAAVGLRNAAAQQTGADFYTVIRTYRLSGSSDQVQQKLSSGYLPLISQTAGFIEYSVVVSGTGDTVTTITVFQSQAQLQAASQSEESWVQQNLASLLPNPATVIQGDTVVYNLNTAQICTPAGVPTAIVSPTATTPATVIPSATPCTGIGCPCNGGVQGACDNGLVCCQSQMNGGPIPGGAGMCAAADACGNGSATPVS